MRKHGLSVLAAVTLSLALAAVAVAQTTEKKVVQNPDGSYTIIEYPVKKEITVTLNPVNTTGTGMATILRDDAGTRIKLTRSMTRV